MVQAHFASFALQSPWDIHSENRFEWTWEFKIGLIANLSTAPKNNKKKIKSSDSSEKQAAWHTPCSA